jgi:mono/diheme cytochrome c family protein
MEHKLKFILGAACTLLCGLPLSVSAQALPDDKGKTEFVHNCTACHGVDLVLAVKKTPDDWKKNVYEMASRGVDGTQEDIDNVVVYLDKYFSTESPTSPQAQPPASHPATSDSPSHPQQMSMVITAPSKRLVAARVHSSLAHYLAAFPPVI